MILDKKLNGILDQGAGDLILYETADFDVRDSTFNISRVGLQRLWS